MNSLAERLKAVLEKKGWSARQLSRVAGLRAESHASQLLHGADPQLSTLIAVADALEVSAGWLATGEGSSEPIRINRRDLAARVTREAGVDERAIELILKQPQNPERTTLDWIDQIRLAALAFENTAPAAMFRRKRT